MTTITTSQAFPDRGPHVNATVTLLTTFYPDDFPTENTERIFAVLSFSAGVDYQEGYTGRDFTLNQMSMVLWSGSSYPTPLALDGSAAPGQTYLNRVVSFRALRYPISSTPEHAPMLIAFGSVEAPPDAVAGRSTPFACGWRAPGATYAGWNTTACSLRALTRTDSKFRSDQLESAYECQVRQSQLRERNTLFFIFLFEWSVVFSGGRRHFAV